MIFHHGRTSAPKIQLKPKYYIPREHMDLSKRAKEYAVSAHGPQMYGTHPYSAHLDAVAKLAEAYGIEAQVVAYLHDVVEDTSVSELDIEKEFGSYIASCVSILTDESGQNRKERKAKTYAKMSKVSGTHELALLVKTADRLANVLACIADNRTDKLEMYKTEHPTFKQAVYREGLCNDLWSRLGDAIER